MSFVEQPANCNAAHPRNNQWGRPAVTRLTDATRSLNYATTGGATRCVYATLNLHCPTCAGARHVSRSPRGGYTEHQCPWRRENNLAWLVLDIHNENPSCAYIIVSTPGKLPAAPRLKHGKGQTLNAARNTPAKHTWRLEQKQSGWAEVL